MHLEAEIVYHRDALGGRDRVRLEMHSDVVDLEAVDQQGGVTAAVTLFIG
jgi:hypothetical protein